MSTIVNGKAVDYHDEYPKHKGPPPVPNYQGDKMVKVREPVYVVELDAGAFRALWELLESDAKRRFPTRSTYPWVTALLRAVDSFRSAYWAKHPDEIPKPRRLVRRKR